MNRCEQHKALRTRLDRNGIASLEPSERAALARCPLCGSEIVAVQDALGALVGMGPPEPDLEEDEHPSGSIPVDTSGPPNAWMRDIARPEPPSRQRQWASVGSALVMVLLAVIAAIIW